MTYYERNKEKVKARSRKWAADNPERRREIHQAWNQRDHWATKGKVITHYSGGINSCACCGESELKFLTIDHTNGGGNKHRKEIKNSGGIQFCRWLIRNGLPEGYTILCFNCNMAKGIFGRCPHAC